MNQVREGIRALSSLMFGFVAAPLLLILVYGASFAFYIAAAAINITGFTQFRLEHDNYLNAASISTYVLAILLIVILRMSRTKEEHAKDVLGEDEYLISVLTGTGMFLGYYPVFLYLRIQTGHASDFFVEDIDSIQAVIFGYNQLLKGLMLDFFEFFNVELLETRYVTGWNFETIFSFVARVLTGPVCLYLMFLHVQAMKDATIVSD